MQTWGSCSLSKPEALDKEAGAGAGGTRAAPSEPRKQTFPPGSRGVSTGLKFLSLKWILEQEATEFCTHSFSHQVLTEPLYVKHYYGDDFKVQEIVVFYETHGLLGWGSCQWTQAHSPTGPWVTSPAQMPKEQPIGVWPHSRALATSFRHGLEHGDSALSGGSGSWWPAPQHWHGDPCLEEASSPSARLWGVVI